MEIEKTYIISADIPQIDVHYRIANLSEKPLEFFFWSHHIPQLSEKDWILVVPTDQGIKTNSDKEGNVIYNVKGAALTQDFGKDARKGEIAEGWVSAYSAKTKETMVAQFDFAKLLQIYSWKGAPTTFEWMYKPCSLKPGESWETNIKLIYMEKTEIADIKGKVGNIK